MADEVVQSDATVPDLAPVEAPVEPPPEPPFDGAAIALVYVPGATCELPARDLTAAEVQTWAAAFDWAAFVAAGLYTPGPAWPVPPAAAKE